MFIACINTNRYRTTAMAADERGRGNYRFARPKHYISTQHHTFVTLRQYCVYDYPYK